MGKILTIKNADFSANAISTVTPETPPREMYDVSGARRNYAVYATSDSSTATVSNITACSGICVSNYVAIPEGAVRIIVSGLHANGAIRFRFSQTASDSEAVQQSIPARTGNAGILYSSSTLSEDGSAELAVPSGVNYFIASIFRDTSGSSTSAKQAAANNADLTGVSIKVYFS